MVERQVRHVEEGTRTILSHAGMGPEWWPLAVSHFCHSANISPDAEGRTAWRLRHTTPFNGDKIPFGAMIHFLPPKPLLNKVPKFGPRGVPGIFLGWYLHSGGNWKGEYLVADLRDFRSRQFGRSPKKLPTDVGLIRYFRVRELVYDRTRPFFYPFVKRGMHASSRNSTLVRGPVSTHKLTTPTRGAKSPMGATPWATLRPSRGVLSWPQLKG